MKEAWAPRESFCGNWACNALILVGLTSLFHLLTVWQIDAYYATHLPHYDSVGTYTKAFRVKSLWESEGAVAAWALASGNFLSVNQGLAMFLAAPILPAQPSSLQFYNSLCVFIGMAGLYSCARTFGCGTARSTVAALSLFLPDTLWWWQGGLQDMQRDPSFLALLVGCFFLTFSHFRVPRPAKAWAVGAIAMMVIFSRDAATPALVAIMGPIWLVGAVRSYGRRGFSGLLVDFGPIAALGAVAVVLNSILYGAPILNRLGDPYLNQMRFDSAWQSLFANLANSASIIFGVTAHGGNTLAQTLAIMAVLLVIPAGLLLTRRVRLQWPCGGAIAAAGAWAYFIVVASISFVFKAGNATFPTAKHVLYPSLLLFYALVFLLIASITGRSRLGNKGRIITASLVAVVVFVGAVYRIESRSPVEDPALIAARPDIIKALTNQPKATVLPLWHDGISIHAVAFYAAQQGREAPTTARFRLPDGRVLDTAVGVPPGADPGVMLQALTETAFCGSDFILTAEKPEIYANEGASLFIFRHGQPLVERLLNHPEFQTVLRYSSRGTWIRILGNPARSSHPECRRQGGLQPAR